MTRTLPPSIPAPGTSVSRRAVLGGLAGLAVGGSGCLQRARSVVNRSGPEPISLSIKTVPTDSDPRSILIARFLAEQLTAVGIDAQVVPMRPEELLRDVLVNRRFDIYVARHPGSHDPDFLRSFLHSRFGSEPGWQNPFGYANLVVDDLLTRQRRQSGEERIGTLRELQRAVATDCPFAVVAFPDDIRAVRTDRITGWTDHALHTPQSYLRVEERDDDAAPSTLDEDAPTTATPTASDAGTSALRMTLTDARPTKNLNPLSVEFRDVGSITGLLYDPLARWIDGRLEPWLAESWEWIDDAGADGGAGQSLEMGTASGSGTADPSGTPAGSTRTAGTATANGTATPADATTSAAPEDGPVLEVTLREDLEWHDGKRLTARDVAFTYGFLTDTSMGQLDIPVPASRFREGSSIVADASSRGDRTVRIAFLPSSRETAAIALTVPPLPAHVWRERTSPATVANFGDDSVTEALVLGNMDPVGSGPLQYAGSTVNERLALEPFPDHFLERGDLDGAVERFAGGVSVDELTFLVVPSGEAAIETMLSGGADGTASSVMPQNVPPVGAFDDARLQVERSTGFYHVGFNVRSAPLSNARFRRGVARLLDKEYLSEEVLENYATPATSPLVPYDAMAPGLVWDGADAELPFPGEDGEIDVERAREPFIEAGYRYREEGEVLVS